MTDRKFTPPTEFPAYYVTRDGREAVVLYMLSNPADNFPVIGYVIDKDGSEVFRTWRVDGWYDPSGFKDPSDIFDKPVTRTWWMNVFSDHSGHDRWHEREFADEVGAGRIGLVRVDQVDGQMPTFTEVPIDLSSDKQ